MGNFAKSLSSGASKNISFLDLVETALVIPAVPPWQRGRIAIVTNVGRDAVDVFAPETNGAQNGRRSRVVLISRRWYQVGDNATHCAGDGDNKARSPGRARYKPL